MKKIYLLLSVFVVALSSCTDVLDVEPTQYISADEAIKDKVGLERALTGTYNALHLVGIYGRNQIIVNDLAADNLVWTGTTQEFSQIENNNITAANDIIDGIWSANFDGINRANNVLAKTPAINDISFEERNTIEGEALFLRALFHFNLANYFGGIPIKTEPTLDLNHIDQARNTLTEVYTQVISDLVLAEQKLPASMPTGRVCSYSASALLARVYLTQYHHLNNPEFADKAFDKATEVIEGSFSLESSYADLFIANSSESIFEVVFDAQNSNRLAQYFFPRSLTGRYEIAPSAEFIQSFEANDERLAASVAYDIAANNIPYAIKYVDFGAGTDKVYVLRLAEMYLIRAEALAYTGGDITSIINDINIIRERAGLSGTTANDYASLKLAIENERRHEFAFEGQWWSDLVRTKRATAVLGIVENFTLFPIPLSEMQTNKEMTQNPGY